jgi:hypothetical protein
VNMKLIIQDTDYWATAVAIARQFFKEYPEGRVGVHKGVVYVKNNDYYLVYRTKTAIVVRGA